MLSFLPLGDPAEAEVLGAPKICCILKGHHVITAP